MDPALPPAANEPVVAIVRVAKPWFLPRAVVAAKMRDTRPQYERLPGLLFKAYSFEQTSGDFGGVYLWRDRASAEAWFNAAWHERVRRERGVEGRVRLLDAPLTLDNLPGGPPAADDGPAVVTVVTVPRPAGVTRAQLRAGFAAALPEYRRVPGLLRKHFTLEGDTGFGGVYLWRDEAAARAWFSTDWQARVRATYGAPAEIVWFDTPILLRGAAAMIAAE